MKIRLSCPSYKYDNNRLASRASLNLSSSTRTDADDADDIAVTQTSKATEAITLWKAVDTHHRHYEPAICRLRNFGLCGANI